jgi:hypothetical protein
LFTFRWLFPHSEREVLPEGSRGAIFRRQNDIALRRMDREVELQIALTELAAIAESLQQQAAIASFVRLLLRDRNARLLKQLSANPKQIVDRTVSADDDLGALVDRISPESIASLWRGYQDRGEALL